MDNWVSDSLNGLQKLRNRELLTLSNFLDRRHRLLDIDKREGEVPADTHLSDDLGVRHFESIQGSLAALQDYEAAMRIVEMSAKGVDVDKLIYPVES